MSINATTSSSSASSASSAAQVSNTANSESAKKSSADSSFKKEMDKVSSENETKTEKEESVKSDNKVEAVDNKQDKNTGSKTDTGKSENDDLLQQNMTLDGNIDYSKFASMSMNDVNSMLSNDIQQMMNTNNANSSLAAVSDVSSASRALGKGGLDFSNSINMTQSDADFFINLTQKNDVSMQNITAQAQTMVDNGAEAREVKQNMQVSQTLLNALSNSRETNQPVRIDFDQNISVILRVNKDGVISANFIPGDKAVEQYLRTNIDSLKATFAQNDLPYSDLSYSNRGSKQQKERRNNNK